MAEDAGDGPTVEDAGEQRHLAATAGAGEQVEAERAAHEVSPEATAGRRARAVGCRGASLVDAVGVVVNAAVRWLARHQSGASRWPSVVDRARAKARMGGEDPVIDDEVLVRAGDQRGAASEEVERVEVEMCGPIVPGSLELEQDVAVGTSLKSVVGERRAGTITHQALEPNSRHIPQVRRQVLARDSARCSCVSAEGKRCEQRGLLELHHEQPFGRGGPATVSNIRVLCSAHNQLLAERDYGRAFIRRRIERAQTQREP